MQKIVVNRPPAGLLLPRLCLLTNRFMTIGQPLPRIVSNCAKAGVRLAILGETDLAPWVALELAEKLVTLMHQQGGRLLVSERADLAHLAGADGVLIASGSLPAQRLKKIVGRRAMIGLFVRHHQELEGASLQDIDFILAGNTFPADDLNAPVESEPLARLRQLTTVCPVPIIAAGGMTPQRAPLALEAGAYGIAMSEAAMESLNIGLLVKAFNRAIESIEARV